MEDYKGKVYPTNANGNLEIIKYINCSNVEVRFVDTGFVTTARMDSIRDGCVKDRLCKSVFGIGFIGDGEFKVSVKRKQTKAYKSWFRMLERCYSKKKHKKYPTYKGCTVHPDWHNFQTFAKWYHDNYPSDGNKYDLDKDILIEGNKVYSASACSFVTHKENAIKARAKSYTFKSPKGVDITIYNMAEFCRDNDLCRKMMSAVFNGRAKSHKGWTKSNHSSNQ